MAPKIFITGATGYIAGDALHALHQAHPDYDYTLLVRTEDKADKVKKAYPSARIVIGDLDDSETLEREAAAADIVLHAADASDHEGAAKAIAKGLASGHSSSNPGYWLHTGGTGILTYFDSKDNFAGLGTHSDKLFNDLDGVEELTTLPDEAFHRNVDKIVLEAGKKGADTGVRTVIVCPPTIYGKGLGSIATRGRQVYELAKLILSKSYIPVIGAGKARWNNVHVHDLSDLFVLLVEAAVSKDSNQEIWGERGYVFAENGEHVWSELATDIAREAAKRGYLSTKEPKKGELGKDEAMEQAGFEAVSWGLNSRGKAERARKYLGWKPKRCSIEEEIPNILDEERERLGQ